MSIITNELQVPLIGGTQPDSILNTLKEKKEEEKPLDYDTASVEEIFKSFEKQTEQLRKPVTSIDIQKPIGIHLTSSGNLVSYTLNSLELYNFATQKTIIKELQSNISYIYSPPQGRYIFVGYLDGKLDKRDPQNFQVISSIKFESKITSLVSDDKALYIGMRSGKIASISIKDPDASIIKMIKKGDRKHPINLLKLSRDNSFLVAYVDVDTQEQFFVFNLQKDDSKPWYAKLDLSPPPSREDPDKLLHISQNCLNIFARGENNKGITMFSLFDGTVVTNMTNMHTNYIESFLVTNDSNTIVTAGRDKKIKVWDWIKLELSFTLIKHQETVQALVFSQDQKVLFSAGLDGLVVMWSMLNHQEMCYFKTNETMQIRTIQLTNDNDFLLAQGNGNKTRSLQLWKLEENQNGFRINVNLKGVSNCYITPNNEYLVTMIGNKSLTIWNTKSRTQIENHNVNCEWDDPLKALNGTRDSEYIFFQKERGDVVMWSTSTQSEIHVFNHPEQIQDITLTKDDRFMICCAEQDIYRWDIAKRKQIAIYNKGSGSNLYSSLSFDDQKLYTSGIGSFIWVFDVEKGGAPQEFDIIKQADWIHFDISPDLRTLIQTNQYRGTFWVSDLIEQKVLYVLNKHRNIIDLISFSSDGKYLISRSRSETIVWETKTWKDIITIDQDVGIVTSSSRRLKAFIHDGIYKPWNIELLRDFYDEIKIEDEEEDQKAQREGKTQFRQLITQDDVKIRGRYNSIVPLIIAKMVKDNKQNQDKYIELLKNNTIAPYNFNIVHYFSYVNQSICLRSSLQNGAGYIKDQKGNTPIDYAIERKSYECSTILLEYMMLSPSLYQKMSQELLIKLIMFSPSNLKEFFDKSVVQEENNDQLPTFGVLKTNPIAFHQSQGNILGKDDAQRMINSSSAAAKNAEPLQFKTLQLIYNLYPGSQSSIDLHDALEKVETLSAFRSEALQALITYKWDLVKKRAYGAALIYILYLINLFALIQDESYILAACLLVFDLYFLIFEIIQIKINKTEYFTDFWNMFDFSTLMMLTFYLTNLFSNYSIIDIESQLNLLSVLNLFAWFRFLSQLRLFQQTRVLIRLIVEVLKDMIPFFVVLIISVLGFSITFLVLNKDVDIVEALKHQYRLMYGDFQPDGYSTTNWILFLIASTLLPLVMLNLLIAIMSDTYARVMADIVPSDFFELNKMILEQEEVMIWNRNEGTPLFLHFGVYLKKAEGDEWEGQIQGILKKLNMQNGTDENSKAKSVLQQEQIYNQLLLQARDTNVKFDEQKKRFDNIQQQVENLKKKFDTQFGLKEQEQVDADESDGNFFEIQSDEEETKEVEIKRFLKRKWESLDIDSSGKLDKSEAKEFFQDLYHTFDLGMLTTEQFEAAFAEYDINNDGKIGKKEGFAFVQQLMIKYHKEEDSESD